MASMDELNAYLESHSYLGGHAATLHDYDRCSEIKATCIDVASHPHLHRWHTHICFLMRKHGRRFNHVGEPVDAGNAPACSIEKQTPANQVPRATLRPTAVPCKISHFCVLDFEKTCERDVQLDAQEIIEFPSVLLARDVAEPAAEFHSFVRPTRNPVLTAFCTELTGITQRQVDDASLLPEVLSAHHRWLRDAVPQEGNCVFITCGDMDLKRSLPEDPNVPAEVPECYCKWVNIKKAFGAFYSRLYKKGKQPRNMVEMLERLEITLDGQHHSGIDDCRNIAKVLRKMLSDGWDTGA